jgi:hypothetical protein
MSRKSVAILLVFAWVFLSAFDLLEDLKVPFGKTAYSESAKSHSRDGSRASLANNMVESAVKPPAAYTPLLHPEYSQSAIHPRWSLLRALDLHKLHRVFLI